MHGVSLTTFLFLISIVIHKSYSKKPTIFNKTEIEFDKNFIEQAYFIDKTDLLLLLLKKSNNTYDYISCPSGFAKTTNLLMIKAFAQYEIDDLGRPKQRINCKSLNVFRGTKIDQELSKVKEDICQHPVIFISLRVELPEKIEESSNATEDEFATVLNEFVYRFVGEYEWLKKIMESPPNNKKVKYSFEQWEIDFMKKAFDKTLTEEEITTSLHSLVKILHKLFKKRIILLVDDYDYVARTAILVPSPKSETFQQIVNKMLGEVLNVGRDMVSYAMIVGITRLPLQGINITGNLTLNEHIFLSDHEYSEYFGYLSNDVKHLSTKHKCDKSELQQIQALYEGYETKTEHSKLLNPFSISSYFRERGYNAKIRPLEAHWIWGRGEQEFISKFLSISPQFLIILLKLTAYNSIVFRDIEEYTDSSYSELIKLQQRNYKFNADDMDPITHLMPFCFEQGLFSYTLYEDEYILPSDEIHQQIGKMLKSYYEKSGLDFNSLATALRNLLDGFNINIPEVKKAFDSALKIFTHVSSNAPTEYLLQSIIRQTVAAFNDLTLTEEKKISRKGRCEVIYSSRTTRSVVHIAITNGKTPKEALKQTPGYGRKKHSTKSVYIGINLDSQKEVDILTEVKTPK